MKQMKKLLSVALALVLVVLLVPNMNANATEATSIPDVTDGNAWWVGHSAGVEIVDGKTYDFSWDVVYTGTGAVANHNGTNFVLYGGNEGKVNGDGYTEYWVGRQDVFGWFGNGATGTLNEEGGAYTWENSYADWYSEEWNPNGTFTWETFQADLVAGTSGTLSISRVGQDITYTMSTAGLTYTYTVILPESATQTIYLSLFTDHAKMTNISYTEEWQLGTYNNPWNLSTMDTRFAVYVQPGATQWVQVDDSNGTTAAVGYVNDASGEYNYALVYGRNYMTPEAGAEGIMSLEMMQGYDVFGVYNAGETAITVYMSLTVGAPADSTGTMDDPEELTLQTNMMGRVGASAEKELEAGNQGYWYTVTATADGNLSVGVNAVDADYESIGWMYSVSNMTTAKYGDYHWSDDEEPVYYETIAVKKGDVVNIFVSTYDPASPYNAPAGTVGVNVNFEALGSWSNPEEIVDGTYTAELSDVQYNVPGYSYVYTATEAGELTITVSSTGAWQFSVSNTTASIYGDTHWSDDDPVVSSETITVAVGDEVVIWVATYDSEASYNQPAGTVTVTVALVTDQEEDSESESETETETETESESESESDTTTESESGTEAGTDSDDIDKKGDLSNMAVYMVVLMGAALVVVGFVAKKRIA